MFNYAQRAQPKLDSHGTCAALHNWFAARADAIAALRSSDTEVSALTLQVDARTPFEILRFIGQHCVHAMQQPRAFLIEVAAREYRGQQGLAALARLDAVDEKPLNFWFTDDRTQPYNGSATGGSKHRVSARWKQLSAAERKVPGTALPSADGPTSHPSAVAQPGPVVAILENGELSHAEQVFVHDDERGQGMVRWLGELCTDWQAQAGANPELLLRAAAGLPFSAIQPILAGMAQTGPAYRHIRALFQKAPDLNSLGQRVPEGSYSFRVSVPGSHAAESAGGAAEWDTALRIHLAHRVAADGPLPPYTWEEIAELGKRGASAERSSLSLSGQGSGGLFRGARELCRELRRRAS